ncbi:MAG: rhodanese-like domain-containing protein [Bacteroidia bacterium]
MRNILFLFIAVITSASAFAQKPKPSAIVNMSSERFKATVGNDKNGVLIDLRTTEEIQKTGMITGAKQLDWTAKGSEELIKKLDKNKNYYLYCASGGRSSDAAEYMEKEGFSRIYTLQNGMTEWLNKGYPVEKK